LFLGNMEIGIFDGSPESEKFVETHVEEKVDRL
jgi:hypothetical protein